MGTSASEIAQELEQTREQAAEKIEKIEQQVTDTTDAVKEQMDWRHQVDSRPLLSLGVAFIGGMVLGGMSGGGQSSSRGGSYRYDFSNDRSYQGHTPSQGGMSNTLRQAFQASGAEDAVTSAAAAMVTTVGQRVKTMIDETYPGFAERYTRSKQADGDLTDKLKAAVNADPPDGAGPTVGL